jgi:hypothetical protein
MIWRFSVAFGFSDFGFGFLILFWLLLALAFLWVTIFLCPLFIYWVPAGWIILIFGQVGRLVGRRLAIKCRIRASDERM